MQSASDLEDVRPKIALVGVVVVLALVFLYVVHIFYLQSLLVVWGGAIIWGSYIYDKRNRRARSKKQSVPTPKSG